MADIKSPRHIALLLDGQSRRPFDTVCWAEVRDVLSKRVPTVKLLTVVWQFAGADQQRLIERQLPGVQGLLGQQIHVRYDFGTMRPELTLAAEHLAKEIKAGRLAVGDIDEDLIDQTLRDLHGTFEIDLCISMFSEWLNFGGFGLWQLAYGEIYQVPGHSDRLRGEHVEKALEDFSCRTSTKGTVRV